MGLFEDMDTVAAANGGAVLPDPLTDFKVRQDQIARRRKQAQQLAHAAATSNGGSGMAGQVYMVGNQWGNVARDVGAAVLNHSADKAEAENALQQRMAQNDFNQRYNAASTPEAKQALLIEARDRGLKFDLESAFRKEEADRIAKREDKAIEMSSKAEIAREAAAARAQEREDQRKWQEEQNALYRRTAADQNARQGSANADLDRQIKEARLEQLNTPKPVHLTAAQQKAYDDSDALIGHIDNALLAAEGNPTAVGAKTMIPDFALQRIDPEGVQTRAAIAGLSAEKVHQLSGAAVSPAEFARLRPYLPAAGDDKDTVVKKLTNLRNEVERIKAIHARGPKQADPSAQPPKPQIVAPQGAIDYLRQHPEAKADFKAKYGYLP